MTRAAMILTENEICVLGARLLRNLDWPEEAPHRGRRNWVADQPVSVGRAPLRLEPTPFLAVRNGGDILVVDPEDRQKDLRGVSSRNGGRVRALGCLADAAQIIETGHQQVGLVVIDIDSCGGIANVIAELMAFRAKFVGTPVMLISADSETDDCSTDRLALCDVTLRGPVSMPRLDAGSAEAQINNWVWQARNAWN